jgi:hypothetical protein
MELLAFDDEGIADLAPDDYNRHFAAPRIHLVEDAKVTEPKLVLGKRVGAKRLDGPAERYRLIAEARGHPVADDPLLPDRQVQKLALGLLSDCNAIRIFW